MPISTSPTGSSGNSSLPSLSSQAFAEINAARRQTTSALSKAIAQGKAAKDRTKSQFRINVADLRRNIRQQREQGFDQLGARGLANQPRFRNQLLRPLGEQQQREEARLRLGRSQQLAQINAAISEARNLKRLSDAELAAGATRSRAQTLLDLLSGLA